MSRTRRGNRCHSQDDYTHPPLRGWPSVKRLGKTRSPGQERNRNREMIEMELYLAGNSPPHWEHCTQTAYRYSGTGYNRVRICSCGAEFYAPEPDGTLAVPRPAPRVEPDGVTVEDTP